MSSVFRNLTVSEVESLIVNGCDATDWGQVKVADSFNTQYVKNVQFEGEVKVGKLGDSLRIGGVKRFSGIYNSVVVDSFIGDRCYINNLCGGLVRVIVENDVVIDNCYSIECDGTAAFGNGVKVAVLNEAGGREIAIFDRLSAQLSYILTFYRYRTSVISKIENLIDKYVQTKRSPKALIEKSSVLKNCHKIFNVNIGSFASLESVQSLTNGTIVSSSDRPTRVGCNVIARDFIFLKGSVVDEGANLTKCFVGESTIVSKGYSAENSIFHANGQFYNGEACSIYAGPHTVTHHKSTLLIGGAYSFYNAGSGTNQSNHMYKLGPVHQGVTARGVKTGSDSYMLWPAHIGCFTVVLGKHYNHPDIVDFPFSYLIEKDGGSFLLPGLNFKTIGNYRDILKWGKRDQRDSKSLDVIDYDFPNWYIIEKLIRGLDILKSVQASKESSQYNYNGVAISSSSVAGGIKIYQQAIVYYLGLKFVNIENQFERLLLDPKVDLLKDLTMPEIVDLGGMFSDKGKLLTRLEANSTYRSIDELLLEIRGSRLTFSSLDEIFFIRKFIWDTFGPKATWEVKLSAFLKDFIASVKSIHSGILADAKKEFNGVSSIGFGVDGNAIDVENDFCSVRGTFDSINEIRELKCQEEQLIKKAEGYLVSVRNNN